MAATLDSTVVRSAAHAGLWYKADSAQLAEELSGYVSVAKDVENPIEVIAAIGPHAGFMYCGSNMANAFKPLGAASVDRIVIMGPSHHVSFEGCAVTSASVFETPLGSLQVDTETVKQLHSTGKFPYFPLHCDEAEHSIEMHLPMLQTVLGEEACKLLKVLSIVVSKLTTEMEKEYAKLLAEFCDGERVRVCLSSDFCHWGPRFQYFNLPADAQPGQMLSEQIERLDRAGMQAIATGDPMVFREYLKLTKNTICGQKPILIFMEMSQLLGWGCTYELVSYDRSGKHVDPEDSTVSYVACHIRKSKAAK